MLEALDLAQPAVSGFQLVKIWSPLSFELMGNFARVDSSRI